MRLIPCLLVLVMAVSTAWAGTSAHARRSVRVRMLSDTDTVYGPHTFSTNASVTNHVETFNVSVSPGPQYRLILENGNPNGTQRPDSVLVRLNGVIIARTADLQGQVSILRIVQPRGQNVLLVTVGSTGSAFIKATLVAAPNPDISLFDAQFVIGGSGSYNNSFTFELPANVSTPHRIFMTNGQNNGTQRVSGGTVSINGTAVLGAVEISDSTSSAAKEITLQPGENTVSLALTGASQSRLWIKITATDTVAPTLTVTNPTQNLVTRDTLLNVLGSVLDQTETRVTVNDISAIWGESSPSGTEFSSEVALPTDGPHTITVVAVDGAGKSAQIVRNITRDRVAPSLSVTNPAQNSFTNQATVTVTGTATDAHAVTVNANGVPLTVGGGGAFSGPVPVAVGANVITVTATDAAGNATAVLRNVTRDTIAPALTITAPVDSSTVNDTIVAVTGTVTDANALTLTVNGSPVTPGGGGSFSRNVMLAAGPNTITIVATDVAGNVTARTRFVTSTTLTIPPDPSTVAPPINPTIATSMYDATSFLYTGANPIQTGVSAGTIKPMTVSVLRGRVLDRAGNALPGVEVTVLNHPEFGKTHSRADGGYDLAVNGGGMLVVNLQRPGYLPAQRQAETPWRDYHAVDDVRLAQLDTAATVINFSAPIQTARGSIVTDTSGTRRATLMFEQGTVATMVFPDSTVPLSSITVRATEYTVGPNGPEAMPGDLPPTSNYTYAAEFSVDQAIAAGAKSVEFSKPVRFYLDNFLGFPIGGIVPLATYDRGQGGWQPEENGRVIKVLSTTGGTATVDVTGSGLAADSAALSQLGFTVAELQELASLYSAGKELWRTRHGHFSPVDPNWQALPPSDARSPLFPFSKHGWGGARPPCEAPGSVIGCESQRLGEILPVAGTPFSLVYQSDRVRGRVDDFTLDLRLTDATIPASLKRVALTVVVAGRTFRQSFPAQANQTTSFTWDGIDAYGRRLQGRQPVTVRLSYIYDAVYQLPAAVVRTFAVMGQSVPIPNVLTRSEVALTQEWKRTIGNWDALIGGVGGWTLNVHHTQDRDGVLLGTGERRALGESFSIVNTVAGTGTAGFSGDNGPARSASLSGTNAVAVAPDGGFYISDGNNRRIRRVDANGIITTFAGTGAAGFSGDGGPATSAAIDVPDLVTVVPDGSVYFLHGGIFNGRIRRIATNGIITTIAGNGTAGFSGDDGPATSAQFNNVTGIAVGRDGSVYITDTNNHRIRMVAVDGTIRTVVGSGTAGFLGDGGPARSARLSAPTGLAMGPDGSLIFSDLNNRRIRKVTPDGIIRTVAGTGAVCTALPVSPCGDGGLALQATLGSPGDVAVDGAGNIYVADATTQRIRRITADGIIMTVFGNGSSTPEPDGTPATQQGGGGLHGHAVSPDGSLYFAEFGHARIRKIEPPIPGFSSTDVLATSEDGGEVYVLSGTGRHLVTLHPLTGDTLLLFGYDAAGRLITITDGDNNVTTIEHNGSGVPTGILGPYGQRTTLAFNAAGYLQTVTNPNSEQVSLTYHTGGLLATMTDARNNEYEFTYDARGRLTRDDDPASGFKTLARGETDTSTVVTLSTALGRLTKYSYARTDSATMLRRIIGPDGLTRKSEETQAGLTRVNTPDGMVTTALSSRDPRFGMQSPIVKSLTVSTPGGLQLTSSSSRNVVLSQAGNPFSLTSAVDTFKLNNRTFTTSYNAAQRVFTSTSPTGRQTRRTIDSQGRLVKDSITGIAAVSYTYDANGRLATTSQAGRTTTFAYDSLGRHKSTTDAVGRTEQYFYNSANRLTRQVFANGREVLFAYDANGNVTSITPPTRPAHGFAYTAVDLTSSYTAPTLGQGEVPTQYTYNLDRQITQMLRPDSTLLTFAYDTAVRPLTVTIPGATYTYKYNATTGHLDSLTARGIMLNYAYDGALPTQVTWSGALSGSVGVKYDTDFRVSKQFVNGADTVTFGYDNDGLLTSAGSLTLTRNVQNGLLTGTTLTNVTTAQTYSGLGELASLSASHSGSNLLSQVFVRDSLGRIKQITETRGGTSKLLEFAYDSVGQLISVSTDSVVTATYTYDGNGNRTSVTTSGGTMSATTDAQDRLLTHGAASFSYNRAGELKQKVVGTDTTRYAYDAAGNLVSVTMPNGTLIEYLVDGANRRVGKKVNGVLQQRWLYGSQLNIVAEFDSAGDVTSRFIYGSRASVPDYMVKAGATYRFVTDYLGNVRLVVNVSTGVIAQELTYDVFGQVASNTAPGFQPFAFAGGVYDIETKLTRFGARDYDAQTGRWTSKDPIGFGAGDSNLYAYAGSDPVNYTDPSGLESRWMCLVGEFLGNFVAGLGALPGDEDTGPGWLAGARIGALTAGLGRGFGSFASARDAAGALKAARGVTRWGWEGQARHNAALNQLGRSGTHTSVDDIIPTRAEAERLIHQSGGTIDRIERAHHPGRGHPYPHINYTTSSGEAATVRVQSVGRQFIRVIRYPA